MNVNVIISWVILFSVFFLISHYLKKHLGIKNREWVWMLSERRKPVFRIVDSSIFVLFLFGMFQLNFEPGSETYSNAVRVSPLFGMMFLQSIVSGIEQWVTDRERKAYYHEWLGTILIVGSYLIILIFGDS
ncbi:DUF4181 domain-containing protein [Bacillus luteolus]|uniref:DUF4181 domain-containing protein n=1 Tax=Litchfieldia luteola TaxID=682179 RepID=A0ABR9QGH9_9BACI|nr:DUF4181 domain-containing protein [Cytobacillus luteolus]MBE4907601.1 DUF4181 domain-containing protein [Cytobacillus luteolus]MBP1944376.1 hypothetical protein [Cytobacillus luteolus]